MCCVLDASKILICITFGQGTKVLLTCWLTWNDNLSSQPLFARAVLKLRGTVPLLLGAARGYGLIAGSALPGFYVVPHFGHRSAPCWLVLQTLFMTASVPTATSTTATRRMTRRFFILTSRPRLLNVEFSWSANVWRTAAAAIWGSNDFDRPNAAPHY